MIILILLLLLYPYFAEQASINEEPTSHDIKDNEVDYQNIRMELSMKYMRQFGIILAVTFLGELTYC